jgi:hypothetical protein
MRACVPVSTEDILKAAQQDDGWMYAADDLNGNKGTIRYLIWSDVLCCPKCYSEVKLWDACVSRDPAQISSQFTCPACSHKTSFDAVTRLTEIARDDLIGKRTKLRARKPVWLYVANLFCYNTNRVSALQTQRARKIVWTIVQLFSGGQNSLLGSLRDRSRCGELLSAAETVPGVRFN